MDIDISSKDRCICFRDVQKAKRLELKTNCSQSDTTEVFKRLRIRQHVLSHSVILHSKIPKITPKRPQITPDHTRSSQEHAFGTYFLTGPRQTIFLHCPTPLPNRGIPLYFKWPFGRRFPLKNQNMVLTKNPYGKCDKTFLNAFCIGV